MSSSGVRPGRSQVWFGAATAALAFSIAGAVACTGEDVPPGSADETADGGASSGASGNASNGSSGTPGGNKCTTKSDCATGFCVDGFCCPNACNGQCESCGEPGSEGQCVTVKGVPRGDRAPCAGGGTACGGSCDGTNRAACAYPESECRVGECKTGVLTNRATCKDGACPPATSTVCADTTATKYCGTGACVGVTQIVAGYDFTCALMTDQTVRCWGNNGFGQLGQGANGPNLDESTKPLPVPGLTGVTKLTTTTAYGGHVCALLADQTAKCWGGGGGGVLGDGDLTNHTAHTPVAVLKAANTPFTAIKDISAGQNVTCLLTTTGVPYCWGLQYYGAVGNGVSGQNSSVAYPVPVTDGGTGASAISVGYNHACLATTSNNLSGVKCWGDNAGFDLGTGTKNTAIATAVTASTLGNTVNATVFEPVRAGGANGTSCAVTNTSTLACWGSNAYGQLGRNVAAGSANDSATAANVCSNTAASCAPMTNVKTFSIGEEHACAANDLGVKCWGKDANHGSLGDGVISIHTVVTATVGPTLPSQPKQVAAGGFHTCALLSDQSVRCWGWNGNGQLGNADKADSAAPVAVLF